MEMTDYDVIIAGSGPAGSTAATLLAANNHRVLVIERNRHPRFHIGESMLPFSTPVFDRLDIRWDNSVYLHKDGAEFVDERNGRRVRFGLNGKYQPYQVERAVFDHMLIDNAVRKGAVLHQDEAVIDVAVSDHAVDVGTDKSRYSARYLIDATGRSSFMGRKNTAITRIRNLGRFALYTHYRNATSAAALAMYITGDIRVLMVDIGWIWVIPLQDNRLSVGLVVRDPVDKSKRGAALFEEYINSSPLLTVLLDGSVQETVVRTEADFSFTNRKRYGKRFACCGDAAGFLDPIFSSGVFLAVTGAERVADRLDAALVSGTEYEVDLHAIDDDAYERGFHSMQLFVERFYQYGMVQNLFFEADRSEKFKNDIAALLSGDLWQDNNDFQRMLLEGRQNRY